MKKYFSAPINLAFFNVSSALLILLFAALPFERIPSRDISVFGTVFTLKISAVIGVLLILFSLPQLWKKRGELLRSPLLFFSLFLLSYLLSTALALDFKRAVFVFLLTAFVMAVGFSVSVLINKLTVPVLVRALYWVTWLVLLYGFYQYFGDLLGLSTAWTGLRDGYTKAVFGFPRIQSTGLEPLYYANFLLIPFAIFSADMLVGKTERPFIIVAIVTQLVLTVSRGALFGAIIAVFILAVFAIRHRIQFSKLAGYAALVLIGILLALGMTSLDLSRLNGRPQPPQNTQKTEAIIKQATNTVSQDDRERNRNYALKLWVQKPLLGIGPGNFDQYVRREYPIYEQVEGKIIVNNETAEMLVEGGALSFISLAIGVIIILWNGSKIAWRNIKDEYSYLILGLIAYLVALAVQYQTFSTLYIMHIWVSIGLLVGLIRMSQNHNKSASNL